MSLFHRPLCALFGGHDFERIGNLIVCSYCGYVAGKKR
jgi:hypothetical protein